MLQRELKQWRPWTENCFRWRALSKGNGSKQTKSSLHFSICACHPGRVPMLGPDTSFLTVLNGIPCQKREGYRKNRAESPSITVRGKKIFKTSSPQHRYIWMMGRTHHSNCRCCEKTVDTIDAVQLLHSDHLPSALPFLQKQSKSKNKAARNRLLEIY